MVAKKEPVKGNLSIVYSAPSPAELNGVYAYLLEYDIHADFWEDPLQEASRNSSVRALGFSTARVKPKPFAFHLIVPEAQAAKATELVKAWEDKRVAILELLTKDSRRLFWTVIVSGITATLAFLSVLPDYKFSSPIAFLSGALIGYILYPKTARDSDPALIYDVE
jgi:hypothetical protein